MEPKIIDYYNELPYGINVINKMNEELDDLQQDNQILKNKLDQLPNLSYMKKFQMPSIIFDTIEEYREFHKELDEFSWWVSDISITDQVLPPDDINYLVLRLNYITQKKNLDWCKYRIDSAVDLYNSFLFDESDDNHYILKNLILGNEAVTDCTELPITYRELSALYKPEWFNNEEYHNIYEIGFLKCKKCNRILDCYDIGDNDDNDDCSDCFLKD